MKYLSLFTGIGGFEYGIQAADPHAECVGYSEIDKPAITTYEAHYEHHNYGDITTINPAELPDFDLVVGGFPCQAFSVAGRRRGFDEARGTLFFDVARILEHKRPRHLVLENVKGLLSHDGGKTIQTIAGILTDIGYRIEWQVLNSKNFGVPQNRERIYIVGHLGDGCDGQVFPLTGEDGRLAEAGEHEPRGSEKFIKTRHLSQNGGLISDSITLQASEIPHIVGVIDVRKGDGFRQTDVANTLSASYYKGHDNDGQRPMIKQVNPGAYQDGRVYSTDGISPTINPAAQAGGAVIPKIMQLPRGKNSGGIHDDAPTLTGKSYQDNNHVITGIARRGREGGSRYEARNDGLANTVRTATGGGSMGMIQTEFRIRRLTPVECERLQGFPDGWTLGSDTQRYKQCGNAVTTNVVEAVARKLTTTCNLQPQLQANLT